jgi:hypothetical protein
MRWIKMEHLLRIELSHQPYRSCAPPSTHQVPNGALCPSRTDFDRIQADHIAGNVYRAKWSLAADSNRALLLTKQARRHLRLQGTYGAESGSPTRLACLEDKCLKRSANPAHCKAIKLSKNKWSGCGESNTGFPDPKSGAFPLGYTPKKQKARFPLQETGPEGNSNTIRLRVHKARGCPIDSRLRAFWFGPEMDCLCH